MKLPKKIKANAWVKNWSGNWGTPFASLYWVYTTDLKPYTGKNLETNLLVCEKGVSSNYIAKKHLDTYGAHIASLAMKDNKLARVWAKDSLATAQELFKVLVHLKKKKDLTASDLLELKQKFYKHIPPHFTLKKVIDYLPKNLQIKYTPKLTEVRQKLEHLFNEVDAVLNLFTKLIARQSKYPIALTEFLTIEEIQIFLERNKLPSQTELTKRSKGTAIFYHQKKSTFLTGTEYQQLQKSLLGKSTNVLKGTVAFQGIARGPVRIVFNPYKVKVFNKGDILVTGMTRPEFLPLMKKAAAFVTDAGGMLSHAAIIARELKKPCILGTEVATKVLKDGDLVEVDANNGVVKKL